MIGPRGHWLDGTWCEMVWVARLSQDRREMVRVPLAGYLEQMQGNIGEGWSPSVAQSFGRACKWALMVQPLCEEDVAHNPNVNLHPIHIINKSTSNF